MKTKLADFTVGEKGRVTGFEKSGKSYRQKLMAMGMIKGTEFTVTRMAPLGDPVEIEVLGFNLSLRKEESAALIVEG